MKVVGFDELEGAFSRLLRILRSWDVSLKDESEYKIETFFSELMADGWCRRDVYELIRRLDDSLLETIPRNALDCVSDIEDSITGDVHPDVIWRFSDDPQDMSVEGLSAYVRSGGWRVP